MRKRKYCSYPCLHPVSFQIPMLVERLIAGVTLERLTSGVDNHVFLQGALAGENFCTEGALGGGARGSTAN
jgi:hypothetical protein